MNKKEVKYVIPWSIVLRGYSFWSNLAILLVITFLLLGFLVYLKAPIYATYFVWLIFLSFLFYVIFGLLHAYGKSNPICKWILDNVTCPNCGRKINSCSYRVFGHDHTEYKLQCDKCNETFYFAELGSFWGPRNIMLTEKMWPKNFPKFRDSL
jgi:hypothetical protein